MDNIEKRITMPNQPTAAGKSSFDLIDVNAFLDTLSLRRDIVFLDVACGVGNYAIEIARRMQGTGSVQALDLWEEGIATLRSRADELNLKNIEATVCDVSKHIPLQDRCVDLCLMATVLHDLIDDGIHEGALREIVRVLKPEGRLAVVEFKKMPGPPGPPEHIRLSPEALRQVLEPPGFKCRHSIELGAVTYLSLFQLDVDAIQ
jgi:ubiquinone/menaquinone biosynthesis C-methylase UbiE